MDKYKLQMAVKFKRDVKRCQKRGLPMDELWAAFPVETISKYKHLNKNIHEKDDSLDLWSLV